MHALFRTRNAPHALYGLFNQRALVQVGANFFGVGLPQFNRIGRVEQLPYGRTVVVV